MALLQENKEEANNLRAILVIIEGEKRQKDSSVVDTSNTIKDDLREHIKITWIFRYWIDKVYSNIALYQSTQQVEKLLC